MATEAALIERVGEVGGRMHTGRSRNDLAHTQRRMFYRDQIERLIEAVIKFRRTLLGKAMENLQTIMPGYTHWRQAQPITLAHYLMAHVDAAGRSVERLEEAYRRTNLSTLGSAALAGTGWPIDRERTMSLLGFDALLENSYDAVAAHDYVVDFASANAIHMSNLSRLAEDLQIWSSDEFGMIDLDEAYAGTSSIMPQKKNPSSLETVKCLTAESIGALTSVISSVKGASYTNVGDKTSLEPAAIDAVVGATLVMAGVVSTMTPIRETMLERASKGFSTMTELADALVRKYGVSFRQAHDIVANVSSRAIPEGKTRAEISNEMVRDASVEALGRRLDVTSEDLKLALDPTESVKGKRAIGGPAPEEVERMIRDRTAEIDAEESRQRERLKKIKMALEELERAEKGITG